MMTVNDLLHAEELAGLTLLTRDQFRCANSTSKYFRKS